MKSVLSLGSYSVFSSRSFIVLDFMFRSAIHRDKIGVGDMFNNLYRNSSGVLLHLIDLMKKDRLFSCKETVITILNIVWALY